MQFERMAVVADGAFESLEILLGRPFAICAVVTDDDGHPVDHRLLRASTSLTQVLGRDSLEGRSIRELFPDGEPTWIERLGRVALNREPASFRHVSALAGGDYDVAAAPLEPPGRFVLAFRDMAAESGAERQASLDYAQTLVRELGHRVMNSFASISAILAMEARAAPADGKPALRRVQGRVQALAELYRRLDGASQVHQIEVSDYLAGNIASFRASFAPEGCEITADLEPMTLPTRAATALALVVNELLTAAVAGEPSPIQISLSQDGDRCCLRVSGGAPIGDTPSLSLVGAFVGELGGEMTAEPDGPSAVVTFPLGEAADRP